MTKDIRERVQKAVDVLCEGNRSEFCRRIGRPTQAIKDVVAGKRVMPGYDLLYDILSSDLGISPRWLLLGEGAMMDGTDEKNEERREQPKGLPLIPMEAFAGPGLPTYEDERVEDYYAISDFKNSDFLIRVKGDSMVPKYNGGDIVACKAVKDVLFLQWGRCYVIYTHSQGIMIKRVQPSERAECIKCVSDNPRYAPFDVPMDDIVQVALVNGAITLD